MATAYLKCTLTNMALNPGAYPSPPNIVYIAYPVWQGAINTVGKDLIGTVDFSGDAYSFSIRDTDPASNITLRYVSWKTLGIYWEYAELDSGLNSDFNDARIRGILSGSYVGNNSETWLIQHRLHVDNLSLPSGEGGEGGTVFANSPPANEPPNKAQNPTPSDGATNINLIIPQISWEAG